MLGIKAFLSYNWIDLSIFINNKTTPKKDWSGFKKEVYFSIVFLLLPLQPRLYFR